VRGAPGRRSLICLPAVRRIRLHEVPEAFRNAAALTKGYRLPLFLCSLPPLFPLVALALAHRVLSHQAHPISAIVAALYPLALLVAAVPVFLWFTALQTAAFAFLRARSERPS
jgi:hypothetical protein